jgi:hypothetical protein
MQDAQAASPTSAPSSRSGMSLHWASVSLSVNGAYIKTTLNSDFLESVALFPLNNCEPC